MLDLFNEESKKTNDCDYYFDFKLKIFNRTLLVSLFSFNDLYFVNVSNNRNYFSPNKNNSNTYTFFISIILYFLFQSNRNSEFNRNIRKFILSNSSSFKNALIENLFKFNFKDFVFNLIHALYYKSLENYFLVSDIKNSKFSSEFIMNCWLEIALYKNFNIDNIDEEFKSIDELSLEDKITLAKLLNEKWFNKEKIKYNLLNDSYLSFYNLKESENNINETIKNKFKKWKQDVILEDIIKNKIKKCEKDEASKIDDDLSKILNDIFEKTNQKVGLADSSFNDDNFRFYKAKYEIVNSKDPNNIKMIMETSLLIDSLEHIEEKLSDYNYKILKFDYKKIIDDDYKFTTTYLIPTPNIDKVLEHVQVTRVFLSDRSLFWKDKGLIFKLVYDRNLIFKEKLSNAEINDIIDRQYTITNGLYKINGNNMSNVFISRETLYKIIEETYIKLFIVFKYYLKIDKSKFIEVIYEKVN